MLDIKSLLQGMTEYWRLQGRPEGRIWGHVMEMNNAMAGLEVSLVMNASTAHCSPGDMSLLTEPATRNMRICVVHATEHGALVLVDVEPGGPDPFSEEWGPYWGDGMIQLVLRARAAGCSWLKLDRDGPVIEGIKCHDWW